MLHQAQQNDNSWEAMLECFKVSECRNSEAVMKPREASWMGGREREIRVYVPPGSEYEKWMHWRRKIVFSAPAWLLMFCCRLSRYGPAATLTSAPERKKAGLKHTIFQVWRLSKAWNIADDTFEAVIGVRSPSQICIQMDDSFCIYKGTPAVHFWWPNWIWNIPPQLNGKSIWTPLHWLLLFVRNP